MKRGCSAALSDVSDCGSTTGYKTFPKANVIYLRCSNIRCDKRSKGINIDQVFGVLQYAVTMHAEALVPVLSRPKSDPLEVLKLREQISVLETVPGTEALIEQKRLEIKRLSAADTELPAWLTIAAVRSLLFWLQDEPKLNSVLRTMLESITVDLSSGSQDCNGGIGAVPDFTSGGPIAGRPAQHPDSANGD